MAGLSHIDVRDADDDERSLFIPDCGDVGRVGEVVLDDVLMRNNSEAAVSSSGVYTGEAAGEPLLVFFPPWAIPRLAFVPSVPGVGWRSPWRPAGRSVRGEGNVRAGRTPTTVDVDEDAKAADVGGVGN